MGRGVQIVLVGLGGQGVLFATRLLGEAARRTGMPIIGSETHGMSRRGGSVASHLKVGEFESPLVRRGAADVLIGLDATEALRGLPFLRDGGVAFVNSEADGPGSFALGKGCSNVAAALELASIEVVRVPADRVARDLRQPRAANLVLLGCAAAHPRGPVPIDILRDALREAPEGEKGRAHLLALEAGAEI